MQIGLPPNCYTREYLKQSGINYFDSILDTNYQTGLEKILWRAGCFFIGSLVLGVLLSLAPFVKASLFQIFCIEFILLVGYVLIALLRYFYLLRVRNKVRRDKAPVVLEPVAIVYEQRTSRLPFINTHIYSGIVYKESGTAKPRFYVSAIKQGLPTTLPPNTALLYKHRQNDKFYSIDDDFNLIHEERRAKEQKKVAFDLV